MKQNKLGSMFGNLLAMGKENSPALLAGLAVAGVALTGWMAWKAGRKADKILDEYQEEQRKLDAVADLTDEERVAANRELKGEYAMKVVPIVLPPLIMGVATGGAIIGSQSINARRIALATTAYNLANESIKDMNVKMRDLLGEKKTKEIKDAIATDKMKDIRRPEEKDVIITGKGNVLCYDDFTGKYFRANAEHLRQSIGRLTDQCRQENNVSINDFYDIIGGIKLNRAFDRMGWDVDDIVYGLLPIDISTQLIEDEPCLVLVYNTSRFV